MASTATSLSNRFLSDRDIVDLTGFERPTEQRRSLDNHGILYVVRKDGKLRTTWYNVNHPKHARFPENDETPNFEAM